MSEFRFYGEIGWEHIISTGALDHILFLVALCAIYLPGNLKPVLILVTAFTIGHSLTLVLSSTRIISISDQLVELLIPFTIIGSALYSVYNRNRPLSRLQFNYLIALSFGLIHGMGFANTIRFMLMEEDHIALPLFSFNMGLEAGQIVVVLILLALNYVGQQILHIKRGYWVTAVSSIAFAGAAGMVVQRFPILFK